MTKHGLNFTKKKNTIKLDGKEVLSGALAEDKLGFQRSKREYMKQFCSDASKRGILKGFREL